MEIEINKVDAIIQEHSLAHRWLIANLLEIQDEFQYLPGDAMRYVADRMEVPIIKVHQAAEFYKVFKLKPPGKHLISVCRGAACHVRGGETLIDEIRDLLDIDPGGTTTDKQFTLDVVNCLGCCALGRVMVIDGNYHVNVSAKQVEGILNKYMENGG